MWFSSWLRKRTVSQKHRPANRFRPTLEVLEDRAVPATFTVNTTLDVLGHDNGVLSLRQAIIDANATPAANTIVLPAATYTLTRAGANEVAGLTGDLDIWASGGLYGTASFSPKGGPLTITGAGAGLTIVDGGGLDRVFDLHFGGTVTLSGMTIQGGSLSSTSYGGGAILNFGTLTVEGCTISGNHVDHGGGGGIYSAQTLTVSNSTISGNTANGFGGGIYSTNATSVTNSTLADNHANGGGAIYLRGGVLTVDGSTLSGNAAGQGGGICITGGAKAVVNNSTLSGNSASVFGGAVYLMQGTLTVSNSTLSSNQAYSEGGGIYILGGTVTIGQSTLSNNSAGNGGGGIYNGGGKLTIRGSTLAGDIARFGADLYGTASIFTSTIGNVYYP